MSGIDGASLTITLTALPSDGVLQTRLANGAWADAAVGMHLSKADLDAGSLRFVPAANASGGAGYTTAGYGNMREHYARLAYSAADGQATSAAATISIDIAAVADAPSLNLLGSTFQRQMFNTGWEAAPNPTLQSSLLATSTFDGWTLVTGIDQHGEGRGLGGGKDGFEIWSNGDQMADQNETLHTVHAATNGGNNWLEVNDAGGAQFQTLGIARQISTDKGAAYTLGFDLAGRIGFGSETTRIAVYVDDVRVASFDNTSGESALNWQHAMANFIGKGGTQTIRIVTDASNREMNGRGMMLDNIALNETVEFNHGDRGGSILLQGVKAALSDTDGSEALTLSLAGLPEGTVLSDGVHSFTVTAQQPVADITGWNTYTMAIKPPASYHGSLNLQVSATSTEAATGSKATVSQTITVKVDEIAEVPVLGLTASQVMVSRTIVDTSWEGVCDSTYGATLLNTDQFAGWNSLDAKAGRDDAFFVWGDGDLMPNGLGKSVTVHPASGAGNEWLGLTNGVNSGASSYYQMPGIERSIATIDGANYTFTLDYAGGLGLAAANTRIGVYVDGVQVGSYASTSSNTALNWEGLTFTFKGNGQPRSLRVQLEGSTDTTVAKGAMLDALKVVETLPSSANVAYGFVNGTVALPAIASRLADGDTEATLKTELSGLAVGSILSDGVRQFTVTSGTARIDISGWNCAALVVTPPRYFVGTMQLQVRATTTELANGTTATNTRDFTVQVLNGTACATPAGMNPYVTYFNDTATTLAGTAVVTGPLIDYSYGSDIAMAGVVTNVVQGTSVADSNESMEEWMHRLSQSLGGAFQAQLEEMLRSGR